MLFRLGWSLAAARFRPIRVFECRCAAGYPVKECRGEYIPGRAVSGLPSVPRPLQGGGAFRRGLCSPTGNSTAKYTEVLFEHRRQACAAARSRTCDQANGQAHSDRAPCCNVRRGVARGAVPVIPCEPKSLAEDGAQRQMSRKGLPPVLQQPVGEFVLRLRAAPVPVALVPVQGRSRGHREIGAATTSGPTFNCPTAVGQFGAARRSAPTWARYKAAVSFSASPRNTGKQAERRPPEARRQFANSPLAY